MEKAEPSNRKKRIRRQEVSKMKSPEPPPPSPDVIIHHPKNQDSFFRTRMCCRGLVTLLKELNPQQKNAVKELGFESLFSLEVTTLPSSLCHWLVKNFDPYSRSIPLANERLKLTEYDVHSCLGFHFGGEQVVEVEDPRSGSAAYQELVKDWRSRMGITKGGPNTTLMPARILASADGGLNFKRDFMVYMISCLISSNQTSQVNHKILNSLVDISKVKDFDWCSYTMRALVKNVKDWRDKPSRFFAGPILFLVVCFFISLKVIYYDF